MINTSKINGSVSYVYIKKGSGFTTLVTGSLVKMTAFIHKLNYTVKSDMMSVNPEDEKPDRIFLILLIIVIVGATIFYYFSEIYTHGPCKSRAPDPECPSTHELRVMDGTLICKCLPLAQ